MSKYINTNIKDFITDRDHYYAFLSVREDLYYSSLAVRENYAYECNNGFYRFELRKNHNDIIMKTGNYVKYECKWKYRYGLADKGAIYIRKSINNIRLFITFRRDTISINIYLTDDHVSYQHSDHYGSFAYYCATLYNHQFYKKEKNELKEKLDIYFDNLIFLLVKDQESIKHLKEDIIYWNRYRHLINETIYKDPTAGYFTLVYDLPIEHKELI